MSTINKVHQSDIIVLGSGIAGLYFALQAAQHSTVSIITKKELAESNSNYAQGGIAAVLDPLDNFDSHVEDTLNAGAYINDRAVVERVVKDAPKHIHRLIELGVGFNRTNSTIDLTQEGGHSHRRIVHAFDTTGKEVERALVHNARNHPNITIHESHYGIDFIQEEGIETASGVVAINRETNIVEHHFSKVIVLATGGCSQAYSVTSNPKIATGDGLAMAWRVGIALKGMEFMQFHPTTLDIKGAPSFLLSEALRGEGAHLRNHLGRRFMKRYDKREELAPRDIVSRAVFEQLQAGPVYLDMTHLPASDIKARFPYIYEQLWWHGLKLDQDRIPISPAAHYTCGGVDTNIHGQTSHKNVYAIGEVAHTGLHGANRLASNSILECLVFAFNAAASIKRKSKKLQLPTAAKQRSISTKYRLELSTGTPPAVYRIRTAAKRLMWNKVGIVRTTADMEQTLSKMKQYEARMQQIRNTGTTVYIEETRNLLTCSVAIIEQALERKESIGAHYIQE